MTITRRTIADEIDRLDAEISELQMDKREIYSGYREQLEKAGEAKSAIKSEVEAVKIAIRQRREIAEDVDVVTARNSLAEEILAEISGTEPALTRATRATRERPMPAGLKIESEAPDARQRSSTAAE